MKEEIELLKNSIFEINTLRRENELMKARLEMFDNMMAMLHTEVAHKSQGMSPDLVSQIGKFLHQKKKPNDN